MIGTQLKKLLDCPAKIICLRCICHEQIHIMGNLTRKCRVSRDTDHLFGIEFARVTGQGAEISWILIILQVENMETSPSFYDLYWFITIC